MLVVKCGVSGSAFRRIDGAGVVVATGTSSLAVSGAVSAEAGIASASVSAAATKARQRMVLELKQWNPTEGVRGQPQGCRNKSCVVSGKYNVLENYNVLLEYMNRCLSSVHI